MQFKLTSSQLSTAKQDTIMLVLTNTQQLTGHAAQLDTLTDGAIRQFIKSENIANRDGEVFVLYQLPHLTSKRLIMITANKPLKDHKIPALFTQAIHKIMVTQARSVLCLLDDILIEDRSFAWIIEQFILHTHHQLYRFTEFKTQAASQPTWRETHFYAEKSQHQALMSTLKTMQALNEGLTLCKDLANSPPNICTPEFLSQAARDLAKEFNSIKTHILNEKQLQKQGLNTLLAVGRGSEHPPRLICLEYDGGKKNSPPIVLVGKGITFDTGGYTLKPGPNMVTMKYDMCGAASVLGLLKAAALAKLPMNIVGVIASAENKISSTATVPDSIIKTLAGITVEITNTDAEGRLVLCDALTYVARFNPYYVIDIATLTGGIIVALGSLASGLYCDDDRLREKLLTAANDSLDRAWHMPLWEEYDKELESNIADLMNSHTPKSAAGANVAARFLARFTQQYRWAHFDCAGVANTANPKAATGRPMPLLWKFLLEESQAYDEAS
ncbi:MAG: leucyl aminopeptidase [Legionellales bacterium]|nr:leucyl aminopeptidase [Legionellales bacterium]